MNIGVFLNLAWRSLANRRLVAILTILSIAVSFSLFLGVDKIKRGAEQSFNSTISGSDVIVGARTGSVNLLLYSVFRIGQATTNISWESYQRYANRADVEWTIPLSLGDSHNGFRVLGTTTDYFAYFRYGANRSIRFEAGEEFSAPDQAVIGSEVARSLDYKVGDELVISHGVVSVSFADHEDEPFVVAGILRPTGTPIDRTVHVSLHALELVHAGFGGSDQDASETPDQITAFIVGLKNRSQVLTFQRDVNTDKQEALQAILPGVALSQLWESVSTAQAAFSAIAALVITAGLLGMLTTILTSLNERRREIAVLRAVGARGGDIFSLLVFEATLLATLGAAIGAGAIYGGLTLLSPIIEREFEFPIGDIGPTAHDAALFALVVGAASILGCVPAWRAYRNSLSDGLTVKV